jgi:hypothetical protein
VGGGSLRTNPAVLPRVVRARTRPTLSSPTTGFSELLVATRPHPAYAKQLQLFGQFVGTWIATVRYIGPDATQPKEGVGVWSFGWILDGRAIQDVITYPDPTTGLGDEPGRRCIGTHVRYYDPAREEWQVLWVGASTGAMARMTVRVDHGEIWSEGSAPQGLLFRRGFTEITSDRFRWKELVSRDDGASWQLEQEVIAIRFAPVLR